MLLTVLTPTFNCARTLPDTLHSVCELEKRFPGRIQHLIGDAGSTDGGLEMIASYVARTDWAQSFVLERLNIPETLNALLKQAKGRWVVILNGDDFFEVDCLAQLITRGLPETPCIVCGQVSVISSEGEPKGFRDCRLDQLDRFMSVNHPAMLVERTVFETVGIFDGGSPTAYDYVWVWRAFKSGVSFVRHPVVFAQVRLGGISQLRAHQAAKEVLKSKMRAGSFLPAIRDYAAFLAKGWFRKLFPDRIVAMATKGYRRIKGSIEHY